MLADVSLWLVGESTDQKGGNKREGKEAEDKLGISPVSKYVK